MFVSTVSFESCSTSGRMSRSSARLASKATRYCSVMLLISASVSYSRTTQSVRNMVESESVDAYLFQRLKSGDVAGLFLVEFVVTPLNVSLEFSFPCVEVANVVLI